MLRVAIKDGEVRIGKHFSVTFQRTLRIPDDGKTYPLPPTLGRFPVHQVKEYANRIPREWKERGGVLMPMYQREALWLAFDGAAWPPNAVQVGVGNINAVSGTTWEDHLSADPQNYIVAPDQMWLDGINAGEGTIRQFVAMPLGMGYTIEAQLTGKENVGGVQIRAFEPKPGRFPDRPPARETELLSAYGAAMPMRAAGLGGRMGIGAGGRMAQKIYPDKYGLDTWDQENFGSVFIHIVNSEQYQEITGHKPPPSPVNAKTYTEHGFPWFELYEEHRATVSKSEKLSNVRSVNEIDVSKGKAKSDDAVEIDPAQIKKIKPKKSTR
jgi:hypothetical protein